MTIELLKNIEKTYKEFQKLRFFIRTEDSRVASQITLVDDLITTLMINYNYVPDFLTDFDRIVGDYYELNKFSLRSNKTLYVDVNTFSLN